MAWRRCARLAGGAWSALSAAQRFPTPQCSLPTLGAAFGAPRATALLPVSAAVAAAGFPRGLHGLGGKFASASLGCRLAQKGQVIKGDVPDGGLLALNTLKPNPGARKQKKRLGRGTGGGHGKTCGRGHKGQYQRGNGPRLGFEGGQTPLAIRTRKRGFSNQKHQREYRYVNLNKIAEWINQGRLDPSKTITMKDLRDSGCINKKVDTGVRLLGAGASKFTYKVDIQVSKVTPAARMAVEAAGGSVTQVYYNVLGLRALFKPDWFPKKGRLLPRPVRHIPVKFAGKFDVVGQLPPAIESN